MKFKTRIKKRSGFDMTPMIDIVFLLIIFFMVSSTLVKTRGMAVKLPESTTSDAETQNLIVVSITASGQTYINEKKVSLRRLGRELKRLKLKLKKDVVVIKGAQKIPYAKMVEVMDIAKMAGMTKISLATAHKK